MSKPFKLTFKIKSHSNDAGFFTSPCRFNFYSDAERYIKVTKDLVPCRYVQYACLENVQTGQIWNFLFFNP